MNATISQQFPSVDKGMQGWAKSLHLVSRHGDQHELSHTASREFSRSRAAIYDRMDSLGLSTAPHYSSDLKEFLQFGRVVLSLFPTEKVYLNIEPEELEPGKPFLHKRNLSHDEAMVLAEEFAQTHGTSNFKVLAIQNCKVCYHGNVEVNKSGQAYGEFTAGGKPPVTRGESVPEYILIQDGFTDVFHYSFTDDSLRKELYTAVREIPSLGTGRERFYKPGYYEMALVRYEEDGPLTPIFNDFRDEGIFLKKD